MAEASFIQSMDENNSILQERDCLIEKLEAMSREQQYLTCKFDAAVSDLSKVEDDNCKIVAAREAYELKTEKLIS